MINENLFYFGVIAPTLMILTVFVGFVIAWYKCNFYGNNPDQSHKMAVIHCQHCNKETKPSKVLLSGPKDNIGYTHSEAAEGTDDGIEDYIAVFCPSTSLNNRDLHTDNNTSTWLIMKKYADYGYIQPRLYTKSGHLRNSSTHQLPTNGHVETQNAQNHQLQYHCNQQTGQCQQAHNLPNWGCRHVNNNTLFSPVQCAPRAKSNRYITNHTQQPLSHNNKHKPKRSPEKYINGVNCVILDGATSHPNYEVLPPLEQYYSERLVTIQQDSSSMV